MSDYSIRDMNPNSGTKDLTGEGNVKRKTVHILTEAEEEQAAQRRVARAATRKRDAETYAAMIAHEPAKRRA